MFCTEFGGNLVRQPLTGTTKSRRRMSFIQCIQDLTSVFLQGEDSSLPVQPSIPIVIPVSVPVQSRGVSKACTSGQRTCSRLPAATGGAVLYRSLMHLEKEVTRGRVAAASVGCHYIPPPMLCPLRVGPGLHCSLATRREQRVQAVQLSITDKSM